MPLQINKGTNPFYPTYYFDMALRQVSLTDTSQRSISYPTIFIWPYNLASENNQIHLGFTRSIPLGGRLYYLFFFKKKDVNYEFKCLCVPFRYQFTPKSH